MAKFKVKINGRHFRLRDSEKKFLISRRIWKPVGFFTTRFVIADDEETASYLVLNALEHELKEADMSTDNSVLEATSVTEDDEEYDANAPGSGFTFYSGDEDE